MAPRTSSAPVLPALRCARCEHVWVPKGAMGPRRCPRCWAVTVPHAGTKA